MRTGYPVITDATHPLFAAQEAGWPDHRPHEAMRAVIEHLKKPAPANSANHPAFADDFVVNDQAERERAEEAAAAAVDDDQRR